MKILHYYPKEEEEENTHQLDESKRKQDSSLQSLQHWRVPTSSCGCRQKSPSSRYSLIMPHRDSFFFPWPKTHPVRPHWIAIALFAHAHPPFGLPPSLSLSPEIIVSLILF